MTTLTLPDSPEEYLAWTIDELHDHHADLRLAGRDELPAIGIKTPLQLAQRLYLINAAIEVKVREESVVRAQCEFVRRVMALVSESEASRG